MYKRCLSTQASGGSVPTAFTSTSAALQLVQTIYQHPKAGLDASTNGTVLIT
jgi:hypothetical protein